MAIYDGNKFAKKLYIGSKPVRALYAGSGKVWPNVVRVDRGEEFGEWQYDDPVRRRTVTPWEQDVYCDDSVGERRTGTPYTQEETATSSIEWDGSTYWNGSCGLSYYYEDYKKVRNRYTYSDGVVRYSDYYNGDKRARCIDGQCGYEMDWRVDSDWKDNGYTCNAAGIRGEYDCSGLYCVRYKQQERTLVYDYPDLSSDIKQTITEYRAGSLYSQKKEHGKCGYDDGSGRVPINPGEGLIPFEPLHEN